MLCLSSHPYVKRQCYVFVMSLSLNSHNHSFISGSVKEVVWFCSVLSGINYPSSTQELVLTVFGCRSLRLDCNLKSSSSNVFWQIALNLLWSVLAEKSHYIFSSHCSTRNDILEKKSYLVNFEQLSPKYNRMSVIVSVQQ